MQKHNKIFLSAAKSRANIDVSQRPALRRLLDGAARRLPTSVQTTIFRAMARDGAIRFNLALRPSHCVRRSRLSLSRNHRSKISGTPDRSRRSTQGTAGSPREEQRCAAQHVARMPIMCRFEPGEIGNRTCVQSTVRLRPICGSRCCRQPQRTVAHVSMRWHRLRSRRHGRPDRRQSTAQALRHRRAFPRAAGGRPQAYSR